MSWLNRLKPENLEFGKFITRLCLNLGFESVDVYTWLSQHFPNLKELKLNVLARMPDPGSLHSLKILESLHLVIQRPFAIDRHIHNQPKILAKNVKKLIISDDFFNTITLELKEIVSKTPNLEEIEFTSMSRLDCFSSLLVSCQHTFKRLKTIKLALGCSLGDVNQSGFSFDFIYLIQKADIYCPLLESIAIDTCRSDANVVYLGLIEAIKSTPLKSLKRFTLRSKLNSTKEQDKIVRDWTRSVMTCMNDAVHNVDYQLTVEGGKSLQQSVKSSLKVATDYMHDLNTETSYTMFFCRFDFVEQPVRSVILSIT